MNRLKEQENGDKKARGLPLKSNAFDEEISEDESNEGSETKILNMLNRRLNKFMKKRGKDKNPQVKRYTRNLILSLLISLALVVESRIISRLNV